MTPTRADPAWLEGMQRSRDERRRARVEKAKACVDRIAGQASARKLRDLHARLLAFERRLQRKP